MTWLSLCCMQTPSMIAGHRLLGVQGVKNRVPRQFLGLCFYCISDVRLRQDILSQTPNATENEAEFDISKISRRAKMRNTSQKRLAIIISKPMIVC